MPNDSIITALIGAVTGASGLGGVLALLGKARDNDAKKIAQYYDKITGRLDTLETRNAALELWVDILTGENILLRADIARLISENNDLHSENKKLRKRVDSLDFSDAFADENP